MWLPISLRPALFPAQIWDLRPGWAPLALPTE
jgi:hypothetical protein